jgi:hypothetical protein
VGKYYSQAWIRKNVLRLDDEDIKTIEKEVEQDRARQIDDAEHQGNINTLIQAKPVDNETQ